MFSRIVLSFVLASSPAFAVTVDTTAALVAAVRDGAEGDTIEIAAGTYPLEAPLEPKARMTLKGAGMDKTIVTHVPGWKPETKFLPDPEMTTKNFDTNAYLIRLKDKAAGVTISELTLHGPQMHGAIFGMQNADLHIHHIRIKETMASGLRTFSMQKAKIHDCEFIDAGGRWEKGQPGIKGGITGGGIFAIWMADCEIFNNRFTRTRMERQHEFYGIKVRQGKRCHVHHNTIEVNFSMEFPFENDEDNEIDHNICTGTISIPKHAGGPVPPSGKTFHIHHNWFRDTYSIEFVRNGVEIDHNLFDFDTKKDGGNLISGFGQGRGQRPGEVPQQPREQPRPRRDLDQRAVQPFGNPQQPHHRAHDRHAPEGRPVRLPPEVRFQHHRHSRQSDRMRRGTPASAAQQGKLRGHVGEQQAHERFGYGEVRKHAGE